MGSINDFLEDTLDIAQGHFKVDCGCSEYHFYATCGHVNRTMILIDTLYKEPTLDFFEDSDRCIVMDAMKLHRDRTVRRLPLREILEDVRHILVHAMMEGKVVVVRCGDVVCDFSTLNDEHCVDLDPLYQSYPPYRKLAYVPSCWLLRGGAELRGNDDWARAMYRRPELDRECGPMKCHPHFGVIFTTTIQEEQVEQRLFDGVVGLPGKEFDAIDIADVLEASVEHK